MTLIDLDQRQRALDPTRSFLVQAPAGSGKTELLIQRYLRLLAGVERPESVVAVTFTRKAAGEMRRRVLDALASVEGPEPGAPHQVRTWRLAAAVSRRDQAEGWGLRVNPQRLEIRTIDSLCASLITRMPWLSRMGPPPELVENADPLHAEAARRTRRILESEEWGGEYVDAVEAVLTHLDNDAEALERRLAEMLAKRDQWLRHVFSQSGDRRDAEATLRVLIEERLQPLVELAPPTLRAQGPELARYAANQLAAKKNLKPEQRAILACAETHKLPGSTAEDGAAWKGIANLLLLKEGGWRKSISAAVGFPAAAGSKKQQLSELIQSLHQEVDFCAALGAVLALPPPEISDAQWRILEAQRLLLRAAVIELREVFRQRGQTDFTEALLATSQALGRHGEPTDLALALDYRIEHLLIDEFQDTSYSQFELLERLVEGWTPGDGRSLFLVGDPMQSIYRFREADVGLFRQAGERGVGPVELETLVLRSNFRSQPGVVDWVNHAFPQIFPTKADATTCAVPFSPSSCVHEGIANEHDVQATWVADRMEEAAIAARAITEARKQDPVTTIGVLVRARDHLSEIAEQLNDTGFSFRAVEIDALPKTTIVGELKALTRAWLHPADRLSWLAVLRAPWCGLKLHDLHQLFSGDLRGTVWDRLVDEEATADLGPDARNRVERVRTVFENAHIAPRDNVGEAVEGLWLALGGPACVRSAAELDDARTYLALLRRLSRAAEISFESLDAELDKLYAAPDPAADESLQLMTIHRAKGLEFDLVILPGLDRGAGSDSDTLTLWLEQRDGAAAGQVLAAPIAATGSTRDPLYDYIKGIERRKSAHETARLLYVATTRARRQLLLLGHVGFDKSGKLKEPTNSTLLGRLWPTVGDRMRAQAIKRWEAGYRPPDKSKEAAADRRELRRLHPKWTLPAVTPAVGGRVIAHRPADEVQAGDQVSFHWVGDAPRRIGTVVHTALEQIARDGLEGWTRDRVVSLRTHWKAALASDGAGSAELDASAAAVERALIGVLEDERGHWILFPHSEAHSEWTLSGVADGRMIEVRVDRAFIDTNGIRWIIDYKTGSHQGGDLEAFLDNEQARYRTQIETYRTLLERLEQRPVRAALYFPLLGAWREYDRTAAAVAQSASAGGLIDSR